MTAWQSAFVTCHQDWFQQHRLRLNDYSWSSWDGWPESTGYFWYQLLHDIDDMILVADVAATWCGILTLSLHVSRETWATIFRGQLEFKCYDEKWWVWQPRKGWRQIFSCIKVLATNPALCGMWETLEKLPIELVQVVYYFFYFAFCHFIQKIIKSVIWNPSLLIYNLGIVPELSPFSFGCISHFHWIQLIQPWFLLSIWIVEVQQVQRIHFVKILSHATQSVNVCLVVQVGWFSILARSKGTFTCRFFKSNAPTKTS